MRQEFNAPQKDMTSNKALRRRRCEYLSVVGPSSSRCPATPANSLHRCNGRHRSTATSRDEAISAARPPMVTIRAAAFVRGFQQCVCYRESKSCGRTTTEGGEQTSTRQGLYVRFQPLADVRSWLIVAPPDGDGLYRTPLRSTVPPQNDGKARVAGRRSPWRYRAAMLLL
jgi:hypothetical protein